MDFMGLVDGAIEFAKDKIDRVLDFWDGLEEDKKKLLRIHRFGRYNFLFYIIWKSFDNHYCIFGKCL